MTGKPHEAIGEKLGSDDRGAEDAMGPAHRAEIQNSMGSHPNLGGAAHEFFVRIFTLRHGARMKSEDVDDKE